MAHVRRYARPIKLGLCFATFLVTALAGAETVPFNDEDGLDERLKATFASIPPSTNLTWVPCGMLYMYRTIELECAAFDVPLDYENPTGPRASVPLLKIPAASEAEYQGMIFFNPGGPGASAVDTLPSFARALPPNISSMFDLVAWEPRGIGYSYPLVNCSQSTFHGIPNEVRRAVASKRPFLEYSEEELPSAEGENSCQGGPNDAGAYMSTGVNVRDVVAILDAYSASSAARQLTGADLFNFWGVSYGTFIGQTFASLYPDRVGRIVLDGVVDPNDHVSNRNIHSLTDTDDAFLTFFFYCYRAGRNKCSFYTGSSAYDIWSRFKKLISARYIDILEVKEMIFGSLSDPVNGGFEGLGLYLEWLESYSTRRRSLHKDDKNTAEPKPVRRVDYPLPWFAGPLCSDTDGELFNKTLEDLYTSITELKRQSYIGGLAMTSNEIVCTRWPIHGKLAYLGPFGGKTKNPILFVSNTRDYVTPLENGRSSARSFAGAQLLIINGTGHSSLSLHNTCALNTISEYFRSGSLPQIPGNNCPEEPGAFRVKIEPFDSSPEWLKMKKEMAELREQNVEAKD